MRNALSITDQRTANIYEIPIKDGAIAAIQLRRIKASESDFGLLSYDPGLVNTATCRSSITFIDGEKGILRYRGYPIEELAEKCSYLEVAYLLVNRNLPGKSELEGWVYNITHQTMIHENIKKFMDGFHHDAHLMGILVSTLAALSTFYPDSKNIFDESVRRKQIYRLIAKIPTLADFAFIRRRYLARDLT